MTSRQVGLELVCLYLRLIQRLRPAVFVMENVEGLLSAELGGSG